MYSFTHVKAIIEFSMQICICSPGFDLLIYIYEYIVRYIYIYNFNHKPNPLLPHGVAP